jgi:putative transcriptional regulator
MRISQQELADKTNISRNSIGFIERCQKEPSLSTAFKISQALNKTVDDVFEYKATNDNYDLCEKHA